MAMPISDASNLNTVLEWAMGRDTMDRLGSRGGSRISDGVATDAARQLTAKAYKSLMAGLRPDQVHLSATATVRERLLQIEKARTLTDEQEGAICVVYDILDEIERESLFDPSERGAIREKVAREAGDGR
jgi:hypothetical protein